MALKKISSSFIFIGNYECLDFMNTVYNNNGEQIDKLQSFHDLAHWLNEAGLIDSIQFTKATQEWDNTPQGAHAVIQARAFRNTLRTLVEQSAKGEPAAPSVIQQINTYLHLGKVYSELLATQDGNLLVRTCRELQDPLQLIAPIAESMAKLLTSGHLASVKKCENPNCVLHFYDKSKNHSRRWCSMDACGNRIKAVTHYRRRRDCLK